MALNIFRDVSEVGFDIKKPVHLTTGTCQATGKFCSKQNPQRMDRAQNVSINAVG
jgi:hypothetical protein